MSYDCKMDIPEVAGLPANQLTVGRDFIVTCEGEFPKDLVIEKLQFAFEKPNEKYILHLRSFEFRSSTTAEMKVTSYLAAQVEVPNLVLTDGTQKIELGRLAFKVESVMPPQDPQNPETKQEPFGPIGPATLPVPPLYWALLAGVIALALVAAGFKIYRTVQRRRMLEDLREHDAALSPLAQFHQSFRKLQRQNRVFFGVQDVPPEDILQTLTESYHMFKLYITRRFQVPAMEWSPRLVLKDVRKYHPRIFAEHGDELGKVYKEFERASQDKAHLKAQEVLAIANHARNLVERMETRI